MFCKSFGRDLITKNYGELNIARSREIISPRFHSTQRISIGIIRMIH